MGVRKETARGKDTARSIIRVHLRAYGVRSPDGKIRLVVEASIFWHDRTGRLVLYQDA
jgi:hypothetical protein